MSKRILELRDRLSKTRTVWKTGAEIEAPKRKAASPIGWARIDDLLEGGLPRGAVTELVAPPIGSGGASVIRLFLAQCHRTGSRMALIDGQDCFDPRSCADVLLSRLLWVRCRQADEALKAADILLRDGNMPLVVLDLALNPAAQLRKIPPRTWYRFQRIMEKTTTILLVITPSMMVSSAETRVSLGGKFSLAALSQEATEFLTRLKLNLDRSESQARACLERSA